MQSAFDHTFPESLNAALSRLKRTRFIDDIHEDQCEN